MVAEPKFFKIKQVIYWSDHSPQFWRYAFMELCVQKEEVVLSEELRPGQNSGTDSRTGQNPGTGSRTGKNPGTAG